MSSFHFSFTFFFLKKWVLGKKKKSTIYKSHLVFKFYFISFIKKKKWKVCSKYEQRNRGNLVFIFDMWKLFRTLNLTVFVFIFFGGGSNKKTRLHGICICLHISIFCTLTMSWDKRGYNSSLMVHVTDSVNFNYE